MTKGFSTRLCAVAVLACAGLSAGAAQAATASAANRAKILTQVTLVNTSDLQFGTIVAAASPSVVDVSTGGVRTCGAGLACLGATTAAYFLIGGTTGQVTTVSVPPMVVLTSGSDTMTALLNPSAALVTLVANSGSFSVGGTLIVGGGQADGDYSGTFNATVDYQ